MTHKELQAAAKELRLRQIDFIQLAGSSRSSFYNFWTGKRPIPQWLAYLVLCLLVIKRNGLDYPEAPEA
ncbi:MAG: hypothetical protein ACFB6S_10285 [Geminicoccaceae bacterium]